MNSPLAITSDGSGRLFVAVPGAIRVMGLKGEDLGVINGQWDGVIVEPSDMAWYDNRIYIADAWSGHIAVMDMEGSILDIFGSRGSGPKEFMEPSGIYIQEGIIYVSDRDNGRIQTFSLDGVFLGFVGDRGVLPERLREPTDLVVDDRGVIYAVDEPEQWVKMYRQDGAYLGKITHMRFPSAITRSGDGVAVLDMADGVVRRFDAELRSYGGKGAAGRTARQIKTTSGMTTAGRYVFVTDRENNEIKRFSLIEGGYPPPPDGIPPRPYATVRKISDSLPKWPGKLAWTRPAGDGPQKLFMLDLNSGGISLVSDEGLSVPVMINGCTPVSFAAGPGGKIYCLDATTGSVVISSSEGRAEGGFALMQDGAPRVVSPVDIDVASDGTVAVADRKGGRVLLYGPDGSYKGTLGRGGTSFYIQEPVSLSIDDKDIIYVSDARGRTVLVFSLHGRLLRSLWDNWDVRSPGAVAVSENFVFLLDMDRPEVKVFRKTGERVFGFGASGTGKGDFYAPESLVAISDNRLLVSDTGNARLQEFRIEPLSWARPYKKSQTDAESDRETEREKLRRELQEIR